MFFKRKRMPKDFLRLQLNAAKLPAKDGSRDYRGGAGAEAGADRNLAVDFDGGPV